MKRLSGKDSGGVYWVLLVIGLICFLVAGLLYLIINVFLDPNHVTWLVALLGVPAVILIIVGVEFVIQAFGAGPFPPTPTGLSSRPTSERGVVAKEEIGLIKAVREYGLSTVVRGIFRRGKKTSPPEQPQAQMQMKITVADHRSPEAKEMQKAAEAGVSLGAELDAIVEELNEIGRTVGWYGSGEGFDPRGKNIRAREIGKELYKQGGRPMMQKVWYRVTEDRRGLEMAWDGIGSWMG